MTKDEMSLRRRFVKDFNLPINLIDSPYFEYYMDRYDFFPKEDWNNCINTINDKFEGNIDKWLQSYAQIRDNVITTIENSEAFKDFNNTDLKSFSIPKFDVGDLDIYNNGNTGKTFVSIDLKKANFQALRKYNPDIVLGCSSYEELMEYFGGDDYFKKSKYTRQVIFGKLNPKRTIYFEKYLISQILTNESNYLLNYLYHNSELITVKSDEIVFRITGEMIEKIDNNFLNMIKDEIKNNHNLDVSVDAFMLTRIVCENHNGGIVDAYQKFYYTDSKYREDLKKVSSIFFPQIYAFHKGLELTDNDLYFRAEEQTAKFCHPLKLIGVES